MKVLLISDTHGDTKKLNKIYSKEKPDIVIFSGDGAEDFEEISFEYPETKFIGVKGNMDFNYNMDIIKECEIKGKKILITHGHFYDVKRTYSALIAEAKRSGADIAVFGHTHKPFNEMIDGVWLFNPGSVRDGNYGIMKFEDGEMKMKNKAI